MEEMKMRAHQKVCSTSSPSSFYVAPPVLSLYNLSLYPYLSHSMCLCVCVCTCILSGLAPRMCVVCVRMSQAHHTVILPHIQCCCQCGCLRCGFAFVSTMSHSGYLCPAQCVWFYLSYALYRAWYTPQSAKVLQMEWVHMWGSLVSSQPHTVLDSWCIQQLQLFLTASHLLQSTYYTQKQMKMLSS
jgi:hypothetical protein